MSELELVIIVSFILLCGLSLVVRKHIFSNDKKVEIKEREPEDYNDKQGMTKFNKGTYRNEKGRYTSLNDE